MAETSATRRRGRRRCAGTFAVPHSFQTHRSSFQQLTMNLRMESRPLLSVIVPCYNERATVAELLQRVREVPTHNYIIAVADRSTDGSRAVIAVLAEEWPEIAHALQPGTKGEAA